MRTDDAPALDRALRDRVLERLALPGVPSRDLAGLDALYRAWCRAVPFDNVRKMIALRRGDAPLPGIDADEFLRRWLDDGTGGTCWPAANALHALATALGFDVARIAGSMRDSGHVNHGSVCARVDGERWLVDPSMLHEAPVPLDRGTVVGSDPVFRVEVEPVDDGHLMWSELPPGDGPLVCRLFAPGVSHAFFAARYEASRARSAFNDRLYARCNRPGMLLVLHGALRGVKTASGLAVRALSRDDLLASLRDEFGVSGRTIDAWVRCGALDDSLAPPTGAAGTPPAPGQPPSRRGQHATPPERSGRA